MKSGVQKVCNLSANISGTKLDRDNRLYIVQKFRELRRTIAVKIGPEFSSTFRNHHLFVGGYGVGLPLGVPTFLV